MTFGDDFFGKKPDMTDMTDMTETTGKKFLLGVCQTPVCPSMDQLEPFLERAAIAAAGHSDDGGTGLFLLPELFLGGFDYPRMAELAERTPEVTALLGEFCQRSGLFLAGTFWERLEDRYYNTLLLIGPDGVTTPMCSKYHLFPLSDEERHFHGGQESPRILEQKEIRLGGAICFDLRFPEVFRHQARLGTDVFLVSSQWPLSRVHHLRSLLTARAIENQCYVLSCNGVGPSPLGVLAGHSCLISPWGEDIFLCDDTPGVESALFDAATLARAQKAFDSRQGRWLVSLENG